MGEWDYSAGLNETKLIKGYPGIDVYQTGAASWSTGSWTAMDGRLRREMSDGSLTGRLRGREGGVGGAMR